MSYSLEILFNEVRHGAEGAQVRLVKGRLFHLDQSAMDENRCILTVYPKGRAGEKRGLSVDVSKAYMEEMISGGLCLLNLTEESRLKIERNYRLETSCDTEFGVSVGFPVCAAQ